MHAVRDLRRHDARRQHRRHARGRRRPDRGAADVSPRVVGDRDAPRATGSRVRPQLRPGSVRARQLDRVRARDVDRDAVRCVDVPATDLAVELGNVMAASMVMVGAYAAVDRARRRSTRSSTRCAASLPSYRTPARRRSTSERCAPASTRRARRRVRRGTGGGAHDATSVLDPRHRRHRRRGVQGLRPLHRRVPAARAGDDDARGEHARATATRSCSRAAPAARRARRSAPTSCSRSSSTTTPIAVTRSGATA